jgi:hypothetical protein
LIVLETIRDRIPAIFQDKFDGNPQQNAVNFATELKSSQYKSLRGLIGFRGGKCEDTLPYVNPKPIPVDSQIIWENPDTKEGFVPSHTVCNRIYHVFDLIVYEVYQFYN